MERKSKNANILIWTLILFFVFTVILPIFMMISNIDGNSFKELIRSIQFKEAFFNSLFTSIISTLISVFLAFICAYMIERSNIRHKNIISAIFILPMLIPSISHGLGLINIFGINGIVNQIFGTSIDIRGPSGIIIGSIIYSFPVAFLMLRDSFKYIDNKLYEASEVLGIGKINTFFNVTLGGMKYSILSSFLAVFTMIFTDYGVALAVGGKYTVLPVYLYKEVIGLLDFSKGAIIGLILILPAITSFIYNLFDNSTSNGINKRFCVRKNNIRDIIYRVIISVIMIFILLIILSSLYVSLVKNYPYDNSFTFSHYLNVFEDKAVNNIVNSLLIAFFTAIVGTSFSYFCAYVTTRVGGKRAKLLHILSMISLTIPGIVLGLSFVITFHSTFIYGTVIIIVFANCIHFFASPYLLAYNALSKINKDYEVVGRVFNIRNLFIIKDVIIPLTKNTIIEMFEYFFVNSMITISAVAFLYNIKTMPVSILINQYDGNLMMAEASAVSILILLINILFKFVCNKLKDSNV